MTTLPHSTRLRSCWAVLLTVLALAAITGPGATPGRAAAGSMVFIKDHNVWIMSGTDPSTARPVTTDGSADDTWHVATQDDHGIITAVRNDGYGEMVRMDQSGRRIGEAYRPDSYVRIEDLDASPDGAVLAVSSMEWCGTGTADPNNPGANQLCLRTDVIDAATGATVGPRLLGDYFGSFWSDRDMVFADIDLGIRQAVGTARAGDSAREWFDLCGAAEWCVPGQMAMTRAGDRLVTKLQGLNELLRPSLLQVWAVDAPPTAPSKVCAVTGPTGGDLQYPEFYRPTWSPDGDALAWSLGAGGTIDDPPPGAGIYAARGFGDDCAGAVVAAELIVPDAEFPDWSAAPLGATPDDPGSDGPEPDAPEDFAHLVRLAGDDRLATAVAIAQDSFPAAGSADAVVLARADHFADALAGTPLAHRRNAPMLLTGSRTLDPRVGTEIERLLGADTSKSVYLLGGKAALNDTVAAEVAALGYATRRLAGADRIATSLAVADELGPVDAYLVTTGFSFPDALAAGPAAAAINGAVLLIGTDAAAPGVVAHLESHPGAEHYAIGGPAARLLTSAEPVFGLDREMTATAVADRFFDAPTAVGLARSDAFPDALTGGAHIAAHGGPMLLTRADRLSDEAHRWLCASGSIDSAYGYGGRAALSSAALSATDDAVAGGC